MDLSVFIESILLMMVLFNPFLMSAYLHEPMKDLSSKTFLRVVARAFVISGIVFVLFAMVGDRFFSMVLQVRFASFLIFGGGVFLVIALRHLVTGAAMISQLRGEAEHLSGAIAMPFMIGPGTISASVLAGANLPIWGASLSIGIALAISCLLLLLMKFLFDLVHQKNERLLERYVELIGRASALVVGTIAVEMIFNGVEMWLREWQGGVL